MRSNFAFDIETNSLDIIDAEIVGISFAIDDSKDGGSKVLFIFLWRMII